MEQSYQRRQPAYPVLITDVLSGTFVEQEGLLPNYVEVRGNKVSRVNIIGVVVAIIEGSLRSVILDDGTGQMSVQTLEPSAQLTSLDVGQVVKVIGKIRKYGSEYYINPEIIKITTKEWLVLRKKETVRTLPVKVVPTKETPSYDDSLTATENIMAAIKNQDEGEGVDIETVLASVSVDDAEQLIIKLIKQGEIFELKPGIVKVLE